MKSFSEIVSNDWGTKLEPGMSIVIDDVELTIGKYGEVAIFWSETGGKYYSSARALVHAAKVLKENPDYLPVRGTVAVATSKAGREYLTLI